MKHMSKSIFHVKLDLFYRGERDYIYGPDLFESAIEAIFNFFQIDRVLSVDFSSHGMTRFGMDFFLFESPQDEVRYDFHSKLYFSHNGTKYYGYLVKNADLVIERIPYNEEEIVADSILTLDEKSISLKKMTSFKLTDNYTALTKYLHYKIFPRIEGKWIFVRVLFPEYYASMKYESIKVVNGRILGNKYTRNTLFLNEKKVGTINFALI